MIQDGLAFWNALKSKIVPLVKTETSNCLRCARYDVTTAPNGSKIGVTLPEGDNEIFIPYSLEISEATVGDTVMVVWHGSLSNAKAFWFGNGYRGRTEVPSNVVTKYIFQPPTTNVPTTAWTTNTGSMSADYPVKATLTLANVTASMFPIVVFSAEDSDSENFASVADTGAGSVTIYAKETPDSDISIPTILVLA